MYNQNSATSPERIKTSSHDTFLRVMQKSVEILKYSTQKKLQNKAPKYAEPSVRKRWNTLILKNFSAPFQTFPAFPDSWK